MKFDNAFKIKKFKLLIKSRELEYRLMSMVKSGDGFFWIGGPGEEIFNAALGMHVHVGEGLHYDYVHLHYRHAATLLAMGHSMIDSVRLMRNTSTDPYSGGRSFSGHYAHKATNVMPVTSPVGTQFVVAPGTALAQKRVGSKGISIVTCGEASTAEPDFASGLLWASRPGQELPLLIIVINNRMGISTETKKVQNLKHISDRAKAFGITTSVINGNDPEKAYYGLGQAFNYVRKYKKPFCLEAQVNRLYGHSSASGAARDQNEADPLEIFEKKLVDEGVLTTSEIKAIRKTYQDEGLQALNQVRKEPMPEAKSIYDHVYAPSPVDVVYGKRFFNPNSNEGDI